MMNNNTDIELPKVTLTQEANGFYLGSNVECFTLAPAIEGRWPLKCLKNSSSAYELIELTDEQTINIDFANEQLAIESEQTIKILQAKQSAILIIDIDDDADAEFDWRFYDDGIILSQVQVPHDYSLTAEAINGGKTLIVTIDNVLLHPPKNNCNIDFRFCAVRLNKGGGGNLNEIYYSSDPRIALNRG